MTEHDPSLDLPGRMAAGDESALADLYDRFGARIFALVHRIVGNPRDAEEVVQDTFVTAWKNAARYDSRRAAPHTWLVTMARSKAIDRLRHIQRRPPLQHDEAGDSNIPRIDRTAADEVEAGEQAGLVAETVRALPPHQRRAIELAFFDGLTHPEIAARLGESIGTVKSRIRLGMDKLREKLRRVAG